LQFVSKAEGKTLALDGHFKSVWFTRSALLAVEVHWALDETRVEKYGEWQKSRIDVIRTTYLKSQIDLKT
jgi:hypothetical protein